MCWLWLQGLSEEDLFERRGMGKCFGSAQEYRDLVMSHSGAQTAVVHTRDGRSLDAGWIENDRLRCGRPFFLPPAPARGTLSRHS